jgi:predicted AAA+ superfamily ATPase
VDLLDPDQQLEFNKTPNRLRERLAAMPGIKTIIVDEIQRVPRLLDVVQSLIDRDRSLRVIMPGSSARKLRHGRANLLGGRVRSLNLHPLTAEDLKGSFNLNQALAYGTLPGICVELDKADEDEARGILNRM